MNSFPAAWSPAQSPAVDGVTGATITTEAIRKAVSDCVKQAGVDPANLVPLAVKKTGGQKTLETDMVVVGGGGSGMSATIRGRMNGMNVILVEKMPYIGGAPPPSPAVRSSPRAPSSRRPSAPRKTLPSP